MAFPRALSLPDDFRMAGTFARAVRRDARFQRRFGVSISAYAFGVVVPVVDCAFAGNDFRLAARDSTTRDRICRCAATLLDGCRVPTAALSRPTAGLLFAGHVGRVCSLGGYCLGQNTATIARRWYGRSRSRWHDEHRIRGVPFKRCALSG